MSITIKKYYEDTLLKQCKATIIEVTSNYIILDQTIAYPEGGGQEGDKGVITLGTCTEIEFSDTQKQWGRALFLQDFPVINVETEIKHIINIDSNVLSKIKKGDSVTVAINVERRELLTISHTASHLMYMGCEKIRKGITKHIIGCHISENSARFDFSTSDNFNQDELKTITEVSNKLVDSDYKIKIFQHEQESDALYWECNNFIIPCGGTHLPSTKNIGPICVKRKNLGKGKERLIVSFDKHILDTKKYHL